MSYRTTWRVALCSPQAMQSVLRASTKPKAFQRSQQKVRPESSILIVTMRSLSVNPGGLGLRLARVAANPTVSVNGILPEIFFGDCVAFAGEIFPDDLEASLIGSPIIGIRPIASE